MKLFTIGHSNHTLDKFIRLLKTNGVQTLVDIRTAPYSRYNPQFNKASLEAELPRHGIRYTFAGQQLGGRPSDPACYKSRVLPEEETDFLHEVDYPAIMEREWFLKGIKRLLELTGEQPTAIVCSEEDPAACHRHHLIAQYMMNAHPNVEVRHIRGDGTVFGARSILKSVNEEKGEQLSLF